MNNKFNVGQDVIRVSTRTWDRIYTISGWSKHDFYGYVYSVEDTTQQFPEHELMTLPDALHGIEKDRYALDMQIEYLNKMIKMRGKNDTV